MSNWFQRMTRGILTTPEEKKEIPPDLWYKCPECKKIVPREEHGVNLGVCVCGFHDRVTTAKYFEIIFDNGEFTELDENLFSADPLSFVDFIGGSMGAVVGEKIARAIDYCIKHKTPFMIISRSGGARMMEAAFSLMQMAKTAAKLSQLADAKVPFISFMTDPTTGGVTASYSMLGDVNIAEPGALIGFAGPRVIKQTIGKDLPEGFQRSEFLLEHGFLDYIVNRNNLKETLALQLRLFQN
jgi:acetyl-CoA carboxylase carboxyl transferase subunit beta